MFCGMKSDDKELEALRKMAEDDKTPSHLRLGAIKELARRREAAEPEPLGDAQERMQAIVDRYCLGCERCCRAPRRSPGRPVVVGPGPHR
jgi:hypothetical protein